MLLCEFVFGENAHSKAMLVKYIMPCDRDYFFVLFLGGKKLKAYWELHAGGG